MLIESITSCMEVCENHDPKVISAYFKLTRFYLLFRDNREGNEYIKILCSKHTSFTISFSYFQATSGTSSFIRKRMDRTISEMRFSTYSSIVKPPMLFSKSIFNKKNKVIASDYCSKVIFHKQNKVRKRR